ncbi:major facilitator superfamily domain-containing protein [Exophiala viscosa]|uniref:major facilitator superfamily domain-containing protein n=1 Tax=Exophiala viscosa TaxID=2486360 RepID=UPI002196E146|nr:major facilitator superfamily domain-containing protein [Exophiala viscosa]
MATGVDPEQQHVAAQPKDRRLFGFKGPHYSNPMVQIVVVSIILFLNPGMYNALSGLGGAGQVDATAQNNAGIALHTTFAVIGFVVGIAHNYLGTKWTMAIGGLGYCVYSAAFLCYNHTKNQGFVIFSGALLGFCAAFLWCAQGVVMMSYPVESQRGRAISITWLLFNLGAVIGAAVSLGENWSVKAGHVTDGTYVAFIVLEATGALLCCFLTPSDKIIRKDGTRVQKIVHPGLKSDIVGLYKTLVTDPWIVLLFPMFFASNYFYTYQFNDVNAYYFSTRTRAFNNVFYWIAQIIGAGVFGLFLDWTRFTRRTRTLMAWAILFVLVMAIWGGGYKFLLKTNRHVTGPEMDLFDTDYIWYLILYMCYGLLDSLWQVFCYYTMGAMTNDPFKLAYYVGFYKSIQAVGATTISKLDAEKVSFHINFGTSWGLMAGAMIVALPLYYWRLHNTEVMEADLITPGVTVEPDESIVSGKDKAEGSTTVNEKTPQAE